MVNKNKKNEKNTKTIQNGETTDAGGGFRALKWRLAGSSTTDSSNCSEFFVKGHGVRETNARKPKGRTLFVINIPPFISEKNLENLFQQFGEITEIFLHQNPAIGLPPSIDPYFPEESDLIQGYKVGYIVFENPTSVLDIIKLKQTGPLEIGDEVSAGIDKWISEYNNALIPLPTLEENVKSFMTNFERKELQRIQEEKDNDGQADDEGWVKVVKRGKRPSTQRTERTEEKLKEKKRRFEKQLLNFTPTQIKETRAKELVDLKRKFDEDKQRVALLRQSRKFKPF